MGGRGNNYFAQIRRVLVNNDKAIRKARKGNTTSVVYREMKPYRQDRFRFRSVPAVIYVFFVFFSKIFVQAIYDYLDLANKKVY